MASQIRSRKEAAATNSDITNNDASAPSREVTTRSASATSTSSSDTARSDPVSDTSLSSAGVDGEAKAIESTSEEQDDSEGSERNSDDEDEDNEDSEEDEDNEDSDEESEEEEEPEYDSGAEEEKFDIERSGYLIFDREAAYSEYVWPENALEKLLGNGPSTYDHIGPFLDETNHPGVAETFRQVPPEMKLMITEFALKDIVDTMPGREIRIIWHHREEYWTYHSSKKPNPTPSFFWGFCGHLRQAASAFYKPAPIIQRGKEPYQYFNHDSDTFVIHYGSCGSTDDAQNEYDNAIASAGRAVTTHSVRQLPIKKIKVSYCRNNNRDFEDTIRHFRNVAGLEQLTLVAHYHYRERSSRDESRYVTDVEQMQTEWNGSTWDHYPFEVHLETEGGHEFFVEKESEAEEEESSGEEEESDPENED